MLFKKTLFYILIKCLLQFLFKLDQSIYPPSYRRIKQQEEEMRKGLTEEEIKKLEESTQKKALEMIELLKVQPEIYKQENNLKQEYPPSIYEVVKEQQDCEILSSLNESDQQSISQMNRKKHVSNQYGKLCTKNTFMINKLKRKKNKNNNNKILRMEIDNKIKGTRQDPDLLIFIIQIL
ncbi:unnamed protein product [Paramecium sonneborni]|uniref:Uncharacterized protein n=1 Tax=Paramecium sonneborni TaxID=65129 RepID=A0A8S1P9W7_9CILI|nr:unnamed protein product [Paramecium sonneborni]